MRARRLLLTLGAVLAAALLIWRSTGDAPDAQGISAPQAPGTEGAAPLATAPRLGLHKIDEGGKRAPTAGSMEEDPPEKPLPKRWLHCEIEGGDVRSVDPARLKVTGVGFTVNTSFNTVEASVPLAGEIEVEVTSLFVETQTPAEFEVRVDHPGYLPEETKISAVDVPALRADGSGEYRAKVVLRRAVGVTGVVVDDEGAPLSGATVWILPATGGVPGTSAWETRVTPKDGSFRMRWPGGERAALLAAKMEHRPASVWIEPGTGPTSGPRELRLTRGAEIAGRVQLAGHEISARLEAGWVAEPTSLVNLGEFRLAWISDRVEWAEVEARTDAKGAYRFSGLSEGKFFIVVSKLEAKPEVLFLLSEERRSRLVDAPNHSADIELEGAWASIEVVGLPPEDRKFTLQLAATGSHNVVSREDRHVEVLTDPESKLEVRASSGDFQSEKHEMAMPTVGERKSGVVSLSRKPVKTSGMLRVTLATEGSSPPEQAGFGLFPEGTSLSEYPVWSEDLEGPSGVFELLDIPAGGYTLEARPGGTWDGREGLYLRPRAEIVVTKDGESSLRLEARFGGRARVSALDGESSFVSVACEIRDAQERVLPNTFVWWGEQSVTDSPMTSSEGPAVIDPPLPSGTYRFTFTRADRVQTEIVKIVAGKTIDVRVVFPGK